jgi:hypothetical protein
VSRVAAPRGARRGGARVTLGGGGRLGAARDIDPIAAANAVINAQASAASRVARAAADAVREAAAAPAAPGSAGSAGSAGAPCGIGITFKHRTKDGQYHVKALAEGGPAARSGRIEVGDIVTAVDGRAIAHLSHAELAALVLGPEGVEVLLELVRRAPGGALRAETVALRRAALTAVPAVPLTDSSPTPPSSVPSPARAEAPLPQTRREDGRVRLTV